ncbi:hypothetical protein TNCV_1735491 [Trichonephila clavipes]|nr:hypothetical protein TNCV_1735491 [Trichonephila clavipes]
MRLSLAVALSTIQAVRQLFRVLLCRESTTHLQTTMPSPGLEPRPNGTTVIVINHYTGWAARSPSYVIKEKGVSQSPQYSTVTLSVSPGFHHHPSFLQIASGGGGLLPSVLITSAVDRKYIKRRSASEGEKM